jgi:phosphatidate cytidylyltransferase
MMQSELKKRSITSFFLILLLFLMYQYSYILIISMIVIAIISWIEFYALISKIFIRENFSQKLLRFLLKAISLLYLSSIVYLILIIETENGDLKVYLFYSILVGIASDLGGLIVGKIFKGKKLTNISPNKTISGSVGSLIFSLLLVPLFVKYFYLYGLPTFIMITILISLTTQVGDLLISLLKRKANVKNTSDILPGHGGMLDRIDGIIFAIPIGLLLFYLI